ncbi:uncharacterized protein LOC111674822 [Lucilia cuprina]|uniref:uncharacterized protein LOC111674822 n=1 Tax=Lucilia cuprina TaxID=7375 RepID=UPI001F06B295|nr:uncharacterized protein LOC111674822 [Lucilia cuprina]
MLAANNITVIEPNTLYLDEKPPKIVRTRIKTKSKRSTKMAKGKKNLKQKPALTSRKRSTKINQDKVVKEELFPIEEPEDKIDPNDPLFTSNLEIKSEQDDENRNISIAYDCETELREVDDEDDKEDEQDYNYEHDLNESKSELSDEEYDDHDINEDEDEDIEDEPLIMLTRSKRKPGKKMREMDDDKIKTPRKVECREICKQHCTEKFSERQRKDICDYYWSLNKDDRLSFIRKHIRARRLTRMKRVNANRIRGNNCCYYLKTYKPGCKETPPENSADLIRVCRKFFEATLCTTSHFIKKANDGTVLEIEKDLLLLRQIKLSKEKAKQESQEPKQILDPETGNLITLDPKSSKIPKPKAQTPQEKKENKKRIRRKPGDPLPERFPKPIKCAIRCIYKCHTKFTEQERKQICDFFWSMDYKRRKDFILANIEIKDIETQTTPDFRKSNRPPRTYQTRFFLRTGGMRGENLRVCKDFYEKTLCINRCFIENAIQFADKTTGCYTGSDRRGSHMAPNKISEERKQVVLDHINSYPLWMPNKKTKTKYLHHSLNIRKMYEAYKEKCLAEKTDYVSNQYYYNTFHANFNLLFLANPQPRKGWGLQKANPNISHYTGHEPGGFWINSKGKKLNVNEVNLGQSLSISQQNSPEEVSEATSSASGNAVSSHTINVVNPTSLMSLNSTENQAPLLTMVRSDLNPALYANYPQDSINMFRML